MPETHNAESYLSRSDQFIRVVKAELKDLDGEIVGLMREVALVRKADEDDREEISLEPSAIQRHRANLLLERYQEWYERVRPFLARSPTAPADEFDEVSSLFTSYIALRRVGAGITDEVWRELFEVESSEIVRTQCRLLDSSRECFSLLDPSVRKHHEDLDLRFLEASDGRFTVFANSGRGEAQGEMLLPLDARDIENFVLRYCGPVRGRVRGWAPASLKPYTEFGEALFSALFNGDVKDLYIKHAAAISSDHCGLRIRLRVSNSPKLSDIPWEYLYDGTDFIALTGAVSITRYVDTDQAVRPLQVDGPLRVAVSPSAPADQLGLDIPKEVAGLKQALAPLVAAGRVRLDVAPDGTMNTLQSMLRSADRAGNPFHVWHFIGHGVYLEEEKMTSLLFENTDGTSRLLSGLELGTLFGPHQALRVAVLNACEGARAAPEDSMASVASSLVSRGLPTAVAMQFSITDDAAVNFAEDFYRALADDGSIDSAVSEARRGIFLMPNESEWATPVVLSRAVDDVLFELA